MEFDEAQFDAEEGRAPVFFGGVRDVVDLWEPDENFPPKKRRSVSQMVSDM